MTGNRQRTWWIAITSVLIVLAVVLSLIAAGPGTLAIDLRITRAVQSFAFPGDSWAEFLGYWIGTSAIAIPLVLLVAVWQLRRGERWAAAMLAGAAALVPVNVLTKIVVGSPRPTADQVELLRNSTGNGFPSGHVYGTMLIAGALFIVAPALTASRWGRVGIRALAVAAVATTSYGRVASGAHWPSDVVGGWLWGAVVLMLLTAVVSRWVPPLSEVRSRG